MLSTFAIGVLGTVITRDPLNDLYNENGLHHPRPQPRLQRRPSGIQQRVHRHRRRQAQLQHLTGLIADATVRMPLQLMNFGTPVDNIGTCANAYTAPCSPRTTAATSPDPPTPWPTCGAGQALQFAQHLSGANLALGAVYGLLGAVFAAFVCYVTYSYVMVCCAAFVNALLSLVAAAPAMIHGHPRRRAVRRIKMFFKHAGLVFAYTTYISIAAMIVLKMAARGGYADQVGMTHPLARLFMIAIISAVAIGVFWWLKRRTRRPHPPGIHPLGQRPRPPRPRRLSTRTRRLRPRARPQLTRTLGEKRPDRSDNSPTTPTSPSPAPPSTAAHPVAAHPPPEPAPPTPGPQLQPAHRRRCGRPPAPPAAPVPPAALTGCRGSRGRRRRTRSRGGAAVASHVTQRLHRDHPTRSGHGGTSRGANNSAPPAASGPPPASTAAPQSAPATGHTSTSRPNPSQRPNTPPGTSP